VPSPWRCAPSLSLRERDKNEAVAVLNCDRCKRELDPTALQENLHVCPHCEWHFPLTARERVALLADHGKLREIGKHLSAADPLHFSALKSYRQTVHEAEQRTGLDEAAVAGEASIDGIPVVLICTDFEFIGGTMGSVVGEKVVRAFDLATKKGLPVIVLLASGGARIQEGMLALMQMAKTTAAVAPHKAAGLLFVSVLTNPSFGGPVASFASLADILLAEPGAEIGFAGTRVVEEAISERIPKNARRAEDLLSHGLIDMIVPRAQLREMLSLFVGVAGPRKRYTFPAIPLLRPARNPPAAADALALARHANRPRSRDYIQGLFSMFVEFHGDRSYRDDPAIITGIAFFFGIPIVVVAQEGRAMSYPEGYRKARRLLLLAARFSLPVVTLVDTPGAYPGLEAEYRGVGMAIADCIATLATLPVPILAVVIGEGGSGGALALSVADVILMQENAIFSVISPEGAAAILYRDASRSGELLPALKLQATDLLQLEIIDDIVAEPPGGAHLDVETAVLFLREKILRNLARLVRIAPEKLVASRLKRFRSIGKFERKWTTLARRLFRHHPA
jgi:acetyl-CoA carboxylase carboxyl transferase beta subunit/acetyl-CoA carboxylase carboxyl transferase alpha subunit